MIANIIPLKRLPRQIGYLSYTVPDDLKESIHPGQLVTIPLRKSTVFGLVFSLHTAQETDGELKPLESIVQQMPFLSLAQLSFLDTLSIWYGVSPAIIASMMMPPLQKRKLAKMEIGSIVTLETQPAIKKPTHFFYYRNKEEKKIFLSEKINGTTLIIVPTVADIRDTLLCLPEGLQSKVLTWSSTASQKEQFSAWVQIRNAQAPIIIGTRGSVFLPFQTLDTIIVDAEQHEQHKHWDQAPRYHVHDIVPLLANIFGGTLHFSGYSPSQTMYYASHKQLMETNLPELIDPINTVPTIADMKKERHGKNYSPLSYQAEQAINDTSGDIFFYLNRKGFATSVGCNDCGHAIVCRQCQLPMTYREQTKKLSCYSCGITEPMPSICPHCNSTVVQLRGVGIEQLAAFIREQTDTKGREVIAIDGDSEQLDIGPHAPRIIVGTDAAFAHIAWTKTDAIVFANIDQQLHIPEYTASEHAWHLIQKVQFERKPDSLFVIQTHNPDHMVLKGIPQPDLYYRLDLNLHRALLYPPYSYLIRYFFGHPNASFAKIHTGQIHKKIADALTKTPKKLKLLAPIEMQPRYYRGQYWYAIIIKSEPTLWQEHLQWLNGFIPPNWKVDPRPNSLLPP